MTNSVMTSDLALNELQSNERQLEDEITTKLIANDIKSQPNAANDYHLTPTTNACGQHAISLIGSANNCLSDDDNEPKRSDQPLTTQSDDRNGHHTHDQQLRADKRSAKGCKLSDTSTVCRIVLDDKTLMSLSAADLRQHWTEQQVYIDNIESQLKQLSRDKSDLISLRESEEKLKQQQLEANRRENVLVMRLTTKEQEMQEYLVCDL